MALLSLSATVGVVLSLVSSVDGANVQSNEVRQPRNIYELVYGFRYTFEKLLSKDELKQYQLLTPKQIKKTNPALYERISQDVTGWTDAWLQHLKTIVDPLPEKKLNNAVRVAGQVDAILKRHFDARQWPYRPMRVVFLPPHIFYDERHRGNVTSGMFIPFYPDAFFASIDWPVPLEMVLVHETLHFNADAPFGSRLEEGLTETACRELVVKYGLMTEREIRREPTYELEREGIELVLEEIMKRTSMGRGEAIDLFLEAYLTGRQSRMTEIFGAEPWADLLVLSGRRQDWQTHKIRKALQIERR